MFDEQILTLEEVSKYLRVPVEAVRKEINSGRLRAIDVAGYFRVREFDLATYKNNAYTKVVPVIGTTSISSVPMNLQPAADFSHVWPDKTSEQFSRVLDGVASMNDKEYRIKIGFTVRKSAGQRRQRSLVLVNRYPSVEFVASTDDVQPGGKMASIIRDRKGKQLPVGATVPPEYLDLAVGPYRSIVDGPGAPNGLAVICDVGDTETMVEHALIRYRFREERQ
jgi:excisionase family DNA binding protein